MSRDTTNHATLPPVGTTGHMRHFQSGEVRACHIAAHVANSVAMVEYDDDDFGFLPLDRVGDFVPTGGAI